MASEYLNQITADLRISRDLLDRTLSDSGFLESLSRAADLVIRALQSGHKILLAGNGGSAADAQHIAGELISRFNFDRPALAGIALTTDTSVLTAIGNDYGYEQVFARQINGLGRQGDVFVAISTSGKSPNVIAACKAAREIGIGVIGLSGISGGSMNDLCDVIVRVPSDKTPLIQQVHIAAGHTICSVAERAIYGKRSTAT
jgi:D-sedoheptulose 7-phosphate isomerase